MGVTLTVNEFDALCSMAYNVGISSLLNSTLYRYIISGGKDADIIQSYFCMWSKATVNGVSITLAGLYKRRIAESAIFTNVAEHKKLMYFLLIFMIFITPSHYVN